MRPTTNNRVSEYQLAIVKGRRFKISNGGWGWGGSNSSRLKLLGVITPSCGRMHQDNYEIQKRLIMYPSLFNRGGYKTGGIKDKGYWNEMN